MLRQSSDALRGGKQDPQRVFSYSLFRATADVDADAGTSDIFIGNSLKRDIFTSRYAEYTYEYVRILMTCFSLPSRLCFIGIAETYYNA